MPKSKIIGGADGMIHGFECIFGDAKHVHIVVSEEAKTYRPEMEWLAEQMKNSEFRIQNSEFSDFKEGDAVYRFFELFDLPNVPNAKKIFELAAGKENQTDAPAQADFRGENVVRACCGIAICKISGGRNWAKVFWRG